MEVAWRAATLFVLVWLVAAARQLQAARLALTDEAVFRERLRIEGELRATVTDGLARIAAQGERAIEQASRAPAAARDRLQVLVEGSRRALAEARRISRRYQRRSLRTELDMAVALLGRPASRPGWRSRPTTCRRRSTSPCAPRCGRPPPACWR